MCASGNKPVLLSVQEYADLAHILPKKVYSLVLEGNIDKFYIEEIDDYVIKISRSEYDALLANQIPDSDSEKVKVLVEHFSDLSSFRKSARFGVMFDYLLNNLTSLVSQDALHILAIVLKKCSDVNKNTISLGSRDMAYFLGREPNSTTAKKISKANKELSEGKILDIGVGSGVGNITKYTIIHQDLLEITIP